VIAALACTLLLATDPLVTAETALAEFRPSDALNALEQLRGKQNYERYIRQIEAEAIAHCYLGHDDLCATSFDRLLAVAPGHAVSYELGPKVTLPFQSALGRARERPSVELDLAWERGTRVDEALPLILETRSNPDTSVVSTLLRHRILGKTNYDSLTLTPPATGAYEEISLEPSFATKPEEDQTLEIYLSGFDAAGNEVYRLGSAQRPYRVDLLYIEPPAWYEKWWVWTLIGTAAVAATASAVYFIADEAPTTIDAVLRP
jgi:hypothetical protein